MKMKLIKKLREADDQTRCIIGYKTYDSDWMVKGDTRLYGKLWFISLYIPKLLLVKIFLSPKVFKTTGIKIVTYSEIRKNREYLK